jgi:hypothetical protein
MRDAKDAAEENNTNVLVQGIDLEEAAKNPYTGPDAFYPVCSALQYDRDDY